MKDPDRIFTQLETRCDLLLELLRPDHTLDDKWLDEQIRRLQQRLDQC